MAPKAGVLLSVGNTDRRSRRKCPPSARRVRALRVLDVGTQEYIRSNYQNPRGALTSATATIKGSVFRWDTIPHRQGSRG